MPEKLILDCTCGSRSIWFDKNNPYALYTDKRELKLQKDFGKAMYTRRINVDPDMIADFEDLPFDDNTFNLVVFDPPHLLGNSGAWLNQYYGCYNTIEEAVTSVSKGINECMRVLKPNGVLIFKWSEIQISTRDIISKCDYEPLFGHRSGKKMNTHWLTFMKIGQEAENG